MTTSSVVLQRDGAYSSRSGKGRIPLHGPRARQDAPAASTPATVRLRHGKQRHLSTSANWASAVSQVGTALPYHESQPDTYQPPVVTEHGHVQTPQSKVTIDPINRLMYSPVLFDPVRVPRNPLVLCHGLYGFDVRGPAFFRLHYWGDLLKVLRGTVGAEVFVNAVPGTGAIKDRAQKLHNALANTDGLKGRDINLIGHSMGGLDCRHLISHIKPQEYHPRSLTTLSTPHRGSEFMEWCRATIGIGSDLEDAMANEVARAARGEKPPIPFTLKQPLLSRAQIEEANKKAQRERDSKASQAKQSGGDGNGLPSWLSPQISNWLLDLLDSPAYANLTPSYLTDVFNPSTPDDPRVRYFSIAARVDKINVWHPLWFPKVILDETAAARARLGQLPEPYMRGNDGLVAVESAKWGEFLGVIENCDHWDLRGSSGLVDASATAKAIADSEGKELDTSQPGKTWGWQDVYALVFAKQSKGRGAVAQVSQGSSSKSTSKDEDKTLASIAGWLYNRIPGISASTISSTLSSVGSAAKSGGGRKAGGPAASFPPPSTAVADYAIPSARRLEHVLQEGASNGSKAKDKKFELERMALAVCKKLYEEGL